MMILSMAPLSECLSLLSMCMNVLRSIGMRLHSVVPALAATGAKDISIAAIGVDIDG